MRKGRKEFSYNLGKCKTKKYKKKKKGTENDKVKKDITTTKSATTEELRQ